MLSNIYGILYSLEKLKTRYVVERNYERAAMVREIILKIKSNMKPHQQRVVQERDELQERTDKLGKFILDGLIYETLSEEEQTDLSEQHYHMACYLEILNSRINRF